MPAGVGPPAVVVGVLAGIPTVELTAVLVETLAEETTLIAFLKLYTSSLFGPPQYSDELPLQAMLHPESPSEAGAPPLLIVLPQTESQVSATFERHVNDERKYVQHSLAYSTPAMVYPAV